ncbi:MAG TPA: S41 family peptidase [Kofleriaceae bacterium]|nr:S41 family peptidase [Kofleriaceae bacterium]
MTRALLVALMFSMSCGRGGSTPPPAGPSAEASAASPAPTTTTPTPTTVDTPAGPIIPDTPAGKAFRAWLEVFNSGDEAALTAFGVAHKAPDIVDFGFRQMTGGFDLVAVQKSEPLALTVVVKERGGNALTAVGWFKLKSAEPLEIASLAFAAVPPGASVADMDRPVDAATRARVIEAAAAKLDELYVFPETAKKMGDAVRSHQKAGAYDGVDESRAFAQLLTEHLREVSHDKHLAVAFSAKTVPADAADDAEPSDEEKAQMRAQLEGVNCGFNESKVLDGNIGYLKFNFFGNVEVCGPKATEAFAPLAGVDALVIDLRQNGGGEPEMVAFVSSYLFAKRTHLNDIYERKANKTTKHWTRTDVPGKKLAKQPVYVLTSANTFSGAEEFSYNLKNLKRATIVGEVTGGGAHPTMGARLDDHFTIYVPFARAINPITKTNWEGTGVEPDVKVPADQALETATKLAAETLAKRARKPRGK